MIHADEVELRRGGVISSDTSGTGDGGSVNIKADRLLLHGGGISSGTSGSALLQFTPEGVGMGTDFENNTLTISIDDQEFVFTPEQVTTDPFIFETDTLHIEVHHPFTSDQAGSVRPLNPPQAGNGGDIEIKARDIELRIGGGISSGTGVNGGDAASIRIEAERLRVSDIRRSEEFPLAGSISSSAEPGSVGAPGSIEIWLTPSSLPAAELTGRSRYGDLTRKKVETSGYGRLVSNWRTLRSPLRPQRRTEAVSRSKPKTSSVRCIARAAPMWPGVMRAT